MYFSKDSTWLDLRFEQECDFGIQGQLASLCTWLRLELGVAGAGGHSGRESLEGRREKQREEHSRPTGRSREESPF